MNNIERIKNRVNEYCGSFHSKVVMRYDNTAETDNAIQLYVRATGAVSIDFFLYAMIDLDIDKRLEVYDEVINMTMTSNCGRPTVEFNGLHYDLRYPDYHDSIILKIYFFRALYYANFLNRPELYRKILEIGGKDHFDQVKMLLDVGSSHINNIGCRAQLIDYINEHDNVDMEELVL